MSLIERSLSKLTLTAFKDREGKILVGSLQVMYNPDAIQLDYQASYKKGEGITNTHQSNHYVSSQPAGLSLDLLFDASMPGNTTPIETQLAILKTLCAIDAGTKVPHFLKIKWGKMRWENKGYFACRADGLSIHYTLFDRDATPLRATATLSLVADESFVIQTTEQQLRSPPVTAVNVADMLSLPLIALGAGASLVGGIDYLSLAWQNDLDNLDDFTPGQTLQARREV
ncbi:CIS tube protein [Photorhabdus sp. SF281]|uniref:CIS tube protein n=1 Tax=Photorhabdus sp. SF281 TaxID=3459527 RepID=UPI004043FEF1